jgi:hypothetical protein
VVLHGDATTTLSHNSIYKFILEISANQRNILRLRHGEGITGRKLTLFNFGSP